MSGETGKPQGYQCEIDGSPRAWTGGLHAIGSGWIHPNKDEPPSVEQFLKVSKGSYRPGEWNRYRIECRGDHVRILVNDVLTTDVRDQTFQEGFVGIQHHGGDGIYRFRNIRIKPLPAPIDFAAELPRIPPTEPADALATFQVKAGFRMELVASEPLIRDPVAIDFDENGRMFVVEFPEYNQKHVKQNVTDQGCVKVLEDTDGDGVFDRSEVYVDELSYPSSVACYDGGVYVAAAPEILYCKDVDGDDRADVREVVYTGFGQEFQRAGQAQLNSFLWGLDNRIHVCTSFSGGAILRPDVPKSSPVTVRNRGFLFDPRTRQYEAASGGGQHGLAIDDWGREFRCRNSDPFKLLIYDERYLARNPYLQAPAPSVNILDTGKHTRLFRISQDEPWRVLRTRMRTEGAYAGSNEGGQPFGFFTSATGVTVYRGDAWPDEYRGTAVVGEVANNLIFRAKFSPDGVGLAARRADEGAEFVASTDNWFRPVQFANGPDGALYVVDMYRELIEGASFLPPEFLKHMNVVGGVDRGRIYRIVPEDFKQRPVPQLAGATTNKLVALLEHRNGWHRDTAARLLYTLQDHSAVAPLRKIVSASELPEGRVHALYALDGLDGLNKPTLLSALGDEDPRVRQHAVRLAERSASQSPDVRREMLEAVRDPDVLVRFQSAFSLGTLVGEERDTALANLIRQDGGDAWFRLAVLSAVGRRQGETFRRLIEDEQIRRSEPGRLILTELASQIGAMEDSAAVRMLASAVDLLPDEESSLAQSLVRSAVVAAASADVAKTVAEGGGRSADMMRQLLTSARQRAVDAEQRDSSRVSAIRLLGLIPFSESEPIVRELLDVRQPQTVQQAAVDLVGAAGSPQAAALLLEGWPSFSPQRRAQVFEVLSSRESWLGLLLDEIERDRIPLAELDPARMQILTAHPNSEIRGRAQRLFARESSTSNRENVVAAYQAALELSGSPSAGRQHFKRVCSACHRLEQVGTAVGADLKAIRNRGMPAILLNVLDPNREVKPQYLTYVVMTTDGRVHTGLIQSESANSLTLRRPDHSSVTVLRVDVEEMRSTGLSFMPEGLEKQLDQQAMADLLEYLNSIE